MVKHASIIPLIGGMTLAQQKEFDSFPIHLMTFEGFQANESHLLHYYKDVLNQEIPYLFIDKQQYPKEKADVVGTTCPCAGLSQLSFTAGSDNHNNKWMYETAEYILGEYKPKVFWGENAPGFATNLGKDVREKLYNIGRKNGYTMSVYSTRSILHGNPQIRPRSFYFFWKDSKTPLLEYYNTPYTKIEDLIRSVKSNSFNEPINSKKPSDDPWYRFILEEIYGGISHKTFSNEKMVGMKARSNDLFSYIEDMGYKYDAVGKWLEKNGYDDLAKKCEYKFKKLEDGKNIMRRGTTIPKDKIGAFVSHYPKMLAHPDEDRYITYREAMTIMGLPDNFELLNPSKSVNHICQNVPFNTALDMTKEIHKYLDGKLKMVDSDLVFQSNISQSHTLKNDSGATLESFFG